MTVMLTSLASALNFNPQVNTLTKSANVSAFTLTNNEPGPFNFSVTIPQKIADSNNHFVTIASPYTYNFYNLNTSNSSSVNISISKIDDNFDIGTFNAPISILAYNETTLEQRNVSLQFTYDFCDMGQVGKIKVLDIDDVSSETNFKWKPLDKVEIDIDVQNNRIGRDIDAVVEIDLYDTVDKQFIGVDGDGGDLTEDVSIDDGKKEQVTFTISVPAEVAEGSGRYVLYVKAYEDGEEETECNEKLQNIQIERDSREVKVMEIIAPNSSICGADEDIKFKVANIGRNSEKKILVEMVNKELGIQESREISDLGQDDNPKEITFAIHIPENATQKTYTLSFNLRYKYDTNDKTYDISEDGVASHTIKLEGNCIQVSNTDALITATLESGANAGQEMTVNANIKNTGSQTTSYTLLVTGIDSFATLESINPQTFTLNPNQAKDVTIKLLAKPDAGGDYTFTITALFDGKTKQQSATLTITGKQSVSGSAIIDSLKSNWLIWLIVVINIVLIILIIAVAVRISKRE